MYRNKKIVAIIPARKGSKGIRNKNIQLLEGIPLIVHTLIHAQKSKFIDKVIVSTDSQKIKEIAKEYGAECAELRPERLSNDTAIIYDVLKYEIEKYNLVDKQFKIIILLQPTSPLRPEGLIDNAIIDFVDKGLNSSLGVSLITQHPILMRTIDETGKLNRLLKTDSTKRRQDFSQFYIVNGMIYINKIQDIINGYISLNDNVSPIIVDKKYYVDIDDTEDLKEAERRIKNNYD